MIFPLDIGHYPTFEQIATSCLVLRFLRSYYLMNNKVQFYALAQIINSPMQ